MTQAQSPTKASPPTRKTVLYVGSGGASVFDEEAYQGHLLEFFTPVGWKEVRIDIDPRAKPDIVADACALPFENESVDAIACLATLEHLPEVRAGEALLEFNRVLRPEGQLILQVPNLEAAARAILEGCGWDVLYQSPAGPIRALDLIYGHQVQVPGNTYMSHQTGFTAATLACWLWELGFDGRVESTETDLWAYATKVKTQEERDGSVGSFYTQSNNTT